MRDCEIESPKEIFSERVRTTLIQALAKKFKAKHEDDTIFEIPADISEKKIEICLCESYVTVSHSVPPFRNGMHFTYDGFDCIYEEDPMKKSGLDKKYMEFCAAEILRSVLGYIDRIK